MRAGSLARVATTLAVGFGAGFAGGHALERAGAPPATTAATVAAAPATAPAGVPFATSMPPAETRVLGVGDLAHVELADRDGRPFTLADAAGTVTVVGLATGPCAAPCPAAIEGLLEVRRRVAARAAPGDAASAPVEFVLVSDAPWALPEGAISAEAAPGAPGVGDARWRVGRAGAREIAALRERLGIASPPDATRAPHPAVQLFDADGAFVQRYRADPPDAARLADDIVHLRDRAGRTVRGRPGCVRTPIGSPSSPAPGGPDTVARTG